MTTDPDREPTIGDVLVAIAHLGDKVDAATHRLDGVEAAISTLAQKTTTLAVLFASHLTDHHEGNV